jgi:hypothetical protein
VATDPPADLELAPINGDARTLDEWLNMFQLVVVVLDPYTNESAWLLETSGRVLQHFTGADCRVAFLVTGPPEDARAFLGPWADRILTFADPDRVAVQALGLNELPAFVHIRQDRVVVGAAEGWDPMEWRHVANGIAKYNSWSAPLIPGSADPTPYAGSSAAG